MDATELTDLVQVALKPFKQKLKASRSGDSTLAVLSASGKHLRLIATDYEVLSKPLSRKQMVAMSEADPDGCVKGVIAVDLAALIDRDFEQVLDLFSEKLTGDDLLSAIDYHVVGGDSERSLVHIEVSGDPELCFDHE